MPTLKALVQRARHAYWLNPEPSAYWGSGDSATAVYGDVIEMVESGNRVMGVVKRSGIGTHSGLSVSDTVCQVFFFDEDGLCSLIREFYDRKRAESTAASSSTRCDPGNVSQQDTIP